MKVVPFLGSILLKIGRFDWPGVSSAAANQTKGLSDLQIWSSTFCWVEFVKHVCVAKDQCFLWKRISPLDQVKETCASAEPELRCIIVMTLI